MQTRRQETGAEPFLSMIHAVVDGFWNPTDFHVSEGQASDLEGANVLLADIEADVVIADKGYGASDRAIAGQGNNSGDPAEA